MTKLLDFKKFKLCTVICYFKIGIFCALSFNHCVNAFNTVFTKLSLVLIVEPNCYQPLVIIIYKYSIGVRKNIAS